MHLITIDRVVRVITVMVGLLKSIAEAKNREIDAINFQIDRLKARADEVDEQAGRAERLAHKLEDLVS